MKTTPRNETPGAIIDLDYTKLSNAIADALRLERERVRQGRDDPIWETNPKPLTDDEIWSHLKPDDHSLQFRPHHRLELTYVLAGHGYPTGVKCVVCGDTWPIRPRGAQRTLERLEAMRADLAAQYERLSGQPLASIRREGYWVAVQLLNDIINTPPTE